MKQAACIAYLLAVALAYFGMGTQWAYAQGTPWWTHLTFHFAHGNVFHLAANLLVAYSVIFLRQDRWWLWPLCYAVATGCSFLAVTANPTLGLSGVLFAYLGVVYVKDGLRWKALLYTAAYMAASLLLARRVAVALHLYCLLAGMAVGGFMLMNDNIRRKERMYGK